MSGQDGISRLVFDGLCDWSATRRQCTSVAMVTGIAQVNMQWAVGTLKNFGPVSTCSQQQCSAETNILGVSC